VGTSNRGWFTPCERRSSAGLVRQNANLPTYGQRENQNIPDSTLVTVPRAFPVIDIGIK
jgi:hypothetical protein